jgi:hypothetical protein
MPNTIHGNQLFFIVVAVASRSGKIFPKFSTNFDVYAGWYLSSLRRISYSFGDTT